MSGEPDLGSAELKTDKVDPIAKCAHCRDLDLPFDRVVTCWAYQGAVCDVIVTAKYAHQAPLGDALGRRLGARVYEQLAGDLPSIVTFVPSHYSRQLMRGGIGNLAIAEGLAKRLSTESGAPSVRPRTMPTTATNDTSDKKTGLVGRPRTSERTSVMHLP